MSVSTTTVLAVRVATVSRRGLVAELFIVTCSECGIRRRHLTAGLRQCPGCHTVYNVVTGAVIA